MKNRGFYAGTLRPSQVWYKRAVTGGNLPEKGPGEYWYDYKGFYFAAEGGKGLLIPATAIDVVKVGWRHGATISKSGVLKIVWKNGSETLVSGFIVHNPEQIRQALTTPGWA